MLGRYHSLDDSVVSLRAQKDLYSRSVSDLTKRFGPAISFSNYHVLLSTPRAVGKLAYLALFKLN
jgi:hypothetical protein